MAVKHPRFPQKRKTIITKNRQHQSLRKIRSRKPVSEKNRSQQKSKKCKEKLCRSKDVWGPPRKETYKRKPFFPQKQKYREKVPGKPKCRYFFLFELVFSSNKTKKYRQKGAQKYEFLFFWNSYFLFRTHFFSAQCLAWSCMSYRLSFFWGSCDLLMK